MIVTIHYVSQNGKDEPPVWHRAAWMHERGHRKQLVYSTDYEVGPVFWNFAIVIAMAAAEQRGRREIDERRDG